MIPGRKTFFGILQTFCIVHSICGQKQKFKLVYEWSQLEFDYASNEERQHDILLGKFRAGQIAPIDVDVHYTSKRVFVTVPRFQLGVPATLGIVTDKKFNGNHKIKPYPDWSWHRNPSDCGAERLVSVFRIKIDECERLWVLDNGKIENDQVCPPQILAFDLKTDKLIYRHEIKLETIDGASLLVTPIVDTRGNQCKDTFVYMLDCQIPALYVYNAQENRSWKIQDKTMYPFPDWGTYSVEGNSFQIMDGILGGALSPYIPGKDRILFYHAMSSPTENWVYTSDLRNYTLFKDNPSLSEPQLFHVYPHRRSTQAAAEAMDKDGIMYFGLISNTQIACWNSLTDYSNKTIDVVASNPVTLQFPSGVKMVQTKANGEELWIFTTRFQKLASGTINSSEINFRIQAAKTEDLLHGTKCKSVRKPGGGYGLYRPGK